jgi:CRISPR-associated protein Cmr6
MKQLLPSDTLEFVKAARTDNFGLMTFKAAMFDNDYKAWYMKADKSALNHPFPKTKRMGLLLKAIEERQVAQLEVLKTNKHNTGTIPNLKVDNRLVVGLGTESVYETSMTLHPVYGIPYLPASAIKGVLRNYVINELFRDADDKASEAKALQDRIWLPQQFQSNDDKASEAKALQDPIFCQLFGAPESCCVGKALKGRVIFLDAFPKGEIVIEPDVMTPHYQKYYMDSENKIPPADWLEPNPIVFLTVKQPVFDFHYAVRIVSTTEDTVWKRLKSMEEEKAHEVFKGQKLGGLFKKWLPEALRMHGIGAKTTVGYGVFE